MFSSESKKHGRGQRSIIAGLANTLEWLITAFILAFVFRAFVMEAFRIPTGSMADTLKGAHFRLCCEQCGYRYDYNFTDRTSLYPPRAGGSAPRCPSCGFLQPVIDPKMHVANGDRILVLKCIYQFREPARWDVVVFKNPGEPRINYIKRLVGRPGETVEIIDGDVYINGKIARKPPKVQAELWMPVYDNDYQPVRPEQQGFKGRRWLQPFRNMPGSKWKLDQHHPTVFALDPPEAGLDDINFMVYDTSIGNDFTATYAYDDSHTNANQPYCSDLMVRFYVTPARAKGSIGIGLTKYDRHYKAWVDLSGRMIIAKADSVGAPEPIELTHKVLTNPPRANESVLVKFANVDHQLIFTFGDEELTYDLGRKPSDAGPVRKDLESEVTIFGSGKLTLSHAAISRDIYYTTYSVSGKIANAGEGSPFTLLQDEFFVLGDNSPASFDSRFWKSEGIGNNNSFYRPGVVPRDYLVGKAVFIYWPSGFRPAANFPLALVPNVGQIRFIYGGLLSRTK